jgi:prepilin-type N-terminal cleavage/methylation domain-containing protein
MRIYYRYESALDYRSSIIDHQLRRGVTLIEVLIAMFIMAVGLISVMALFPLGMAQFANAVKDERTLQTAQIVEGHARILWRLSYPTLATNYDYAVPGPFQGEPALQALANPDPQFLAVPMTPGQEIIAENDATGTGGSSEPSFPVYFDPIGWATQPPGNSQLWVGGISTPVTVVQGGQPKTYQIGLPRRSLSVLNYLPATGGPPNQLTARIKLFSLMDDMTFTNTGKASDPAANPPQSAVIRGGRYNAAYLVQRQVNSLPHTANLTVVVYQNRPVADTPNAETYLATTQLTPGDTRVDFPKAGIPSLRKGTWILITGFMQVPLGVGLPTNPGHQIYAYANFYRIVSVQDDGVNYHLEVSPPLKDNLPPQKYRPAGLQSYPGNILAIDNVAEVFERPVLAPNAN